MSCQQNACPPDVCKPIELLPKCPSQRSCPTTSNPCPLNTCQPKPCPPKPCPPKSCPPKPCPPKPCPPKPCPPKPCPPPPCQAGPSDCVPVIEQATATVLTNIRVQRRLRCDPQFLHTKPGILKCLQIVTLLLGLVAAELYKELLKPFGITDMVVLLITFTLLTLYLIHFVEKYYTIQWLHIELVINAVAAVAFIGLGVWLITRGVYPVAAMSIIAFLLYGYDAVLKYIGVRNYAIAQGERTVVTKTTHFSGPASNVPPLTASMINIPPIQICTSTAAKPKPKAPCNPCNAPPKDPPPCNPPPPPPCNPPPPPPCNPCNK